MILQATCKQIDAGQKLKNSSNIQFGLGKMVVC